MIDITKAQNKEPFDVKEYLKCFFIALLPALVISELLREVGIIGMIPTLVPIFGGTEIVRAVRRKRPKAKGREDNL